MNSPSTRMWVGLFVLVVFVAGLAAGVAVRPWIMMGPRQARVGMPRTAPPPGGPPARMTERLLDRIADDVDLTAEQDQQLREVFGRRQQRMRDINDEVRAQFETEQAQMNDEIAAILTPEQMEIFENEIVRMRRDRRGPRGRFGPPRGPRGGR